MYVKDGICCNRRADLEQANTQIKQAWSDYIEPFGTVQMVSEATRVTASSRTLIDHIYTNCTENIGLSDHFPIFFTRKMHVQPSKRKHFTISYRSFKDFDETKFAIYLLSAPWDKLNFLMIDIFQEVGAGKGLRKQSTTGSIQSKDSHTEDPNEIANAFNELFL